MNKPNFAQFADMIHDFDKLPVNTPAWDKVLVGRFITFDLPTADGIELIRKIEAVNKQAAAAMMAAKDRYDEMVRRGEANVGLSKAWLLSLLPEAKNIEKHVLDAQLTQVDNYALGEWITGAGIYPSDLWEVVCPELAKCAKVEWERRHVEPKTSAQSRNLETILGADLTESVCAKFKRDVLMAYVEGTLSIDEENRLFSNLLEHHFQSVIYHLMVERCGLQGLFDLVDTLVSDEENDRLTPQQRVDLILAYRLCRSIPGRDISIATIMDRIIYNCRKGVTIMVNEPKIAYHSRLATKAGLLAGTITLSIDGELAIVDVECPKDDVKVKYHWVTLPESGVDTTVHSMVKWFDDVAAAAIMIVVYPTGGSPKTITVTLNV